MYVYIYIYILNSKIKLFFILQTCVDQPLVQDGSLLQMPDLRRMPAAQAPGPVSTETCQRLSGTCGYNTSENTH